VLEYRAGTKIPERGRKDLAIKQRRTFSNEFKRQVVEEYLSGVSTAAQLMRRHEISSGFSITGRISTPRGDSIILPPTKQPWKNGSGSSSSWWAGSPWRTSF
jgi:hypothetical protein